MNADVKTDHSRDGAERRGMHLGQSNPRPIAAAVLVVGITLAGAGAGVCAFPTTTAAAAAASHNHVFGHAHRLPRVIAVAVCVAFEVAVAGAGELGDHGGARAQANGEFLGAQALKYFKASMRECGCEVGGGELRLGSGGARGRCSMSGQVNMFKKKIADTAV